MPNPFVEHLTRFYTGSATHEGVFDEYNLEDRRYQDVLHVKTRVEQEVLSLFDRPIPPSVILTGNAGDGKTRLARAVVEKLAGKALHSWGKPHEPYDLELKEYTLRVLKDLSDFDRAFAQKTLSQIGLIRTDRGKPLVYLIAANEGKLRDSLPDNVALRSEIQTQLESGPQLGLDLVLFNLNLERTSRYVTPLLVSMLDAQLWDGCGSCPAYGQCPIHFNRSSLSLSHVQERMTNLYQVVEQSGFHITIRDMLIHLSHTLIGTKDCKSVLAEFAKHDSEPWKHVYYQNCFAQEQSEDYRRMLNVVRQLDRLQLGEKSHFDIDTFILHGGRTDVEQKAHERLFAAALDVGEGLFTRRRLSYLAGKGVESEQQQHPVLEWLPHCRRKMYFEWHDPKAHSLLALQTVADFQEFVQTDDDWEFTDRALPVLLCGLNRAMTGFYLDKTNTSHDLFVTSEYQGSGAVVPIVKTTIPARDLILCRYPTQNPDRLRLTIRQTSAIWLEIDQLMFEYLFRLSVGGTLNILAEHCELRLRNFKDQLLGNIHIFQGRVDKRRLEFFVEVGGQHRLVKAMVQNGKVRVQ